MNGAKGKGVQFSLSLPGSEASSRSSSPAPPERHEKGPNFDDYDDVTPGRQGVDVYDTHLSWWRAGLRKKLVKLVQYESVVIAKMQDKIRTPWLDAYFVYSSTLGTHTFFMAIIPTMFFFGYHELGRGLLTVLGLGIYGSSVIKDLFCSPRPFAPPVTRLTIGSHHLEYGFPSTHSTNSISIALLFFVEVHQLATVPVSFTSDLLADPTYQPFISSWTYILLSLILVIYTFSVVFGRLYTAMHSFTDCLMGVFLGTVIWWWHTSWAGVPVFISSTNPLHTTLQYLGMGLLHPSGTLVLFLGKGLGAGEAIEAWIRAGGWEVPLILIPLTLFAVHVHPQPVDDCPCFEDAIAILSAVLGALVSKWSLCYSHFALGKVVVMPGSGWVLTAGEWVQHERGMNDVLVWWSVASLKMVFGILVIFTWRIIAKSALHLILPPTFRLLARAFQLPHRRFYTPATQYKSVPSEFTANGTGGFGLHPIPSVIDLPSSAGLSVEVGGIGSGVAGSQTMPYQYARNGISDLKNRNGAGNGQAASVSATGGKEENNRGPVGDKERTGKDGTREGVKHYDADVLTKVIVYVGIAVLATEMLPLAFDFSGWGVRSWVS